MNGIHRSFFLAYLLFTLTLLAIQGRAESISQLQEFNHSKYYFSLKYPSDWHVIDSVYDSTSMTQFISPDGHWLAVFAFKFENGKGPTNLKQLSEHGDRYLSNIGGEIGIIDESGLFHRGPNYISCTYDENKYGNFSQVRYAIDWTYTYLVVCDAKTRDELLYYENVMNSFRTTVPASVKAKGLGVGWLSLMIAYFPFLAMGFLCYLISSGIKDLGSIKIQMKYAYIPRDDVQKLIKGARRQVYISIPVLIILFFASNWYTSWQNIGSYSIICIAGFFGYVFSFSNPLSDLAGEAVGAVAGEEVGKFAEEATQEVIDEIEKYNNDER